MAQTILGVDFGSYSVKIAQLERTFGEFKLTGFFELPLVAEEMLTSQQVAAAALSKFFSDNPIHYDYSVVSLPGNLTSFRTIELPFHNPKKIDQTLEFELETLIPFDIEEVLFDYTLLERGENTSKILSTYLPEENFKTFLNQVAHSGMDPRFVGVDSLDLSYLTLLGTLPPEGRYAILDLGHTKSNLIIFEGHQVKMVRCFSWGGAQLTAAIAKAGGMEEEEALNYKHRKGQILRDVKDPILQAIEQEFIKLGQEMRQTLFAFYESGEENISALYLCGGTSKLEGVEAFFSNLLNINVSALDVLDDAFTELRDKDAAKGAIPSAFATALHGIYPNKGIHINFRRGEYAYKKDIEQLGGSLKKIGVMAASVVGIGLIYFIISYFSLSSQVDAMNKDLAKVVKGSVAQMPKKGTASPKKIVSSLDGKITTLNERLKKLQGDAALSSLEVLKLVSSTLPPREQLVVDIDEINISPQRVRLEGRTGSYEAVNKVKAALEKVPQFKNVQKGDERKGTRDQIKFKLSFDLGEEVESS